MRRFCLVVVGGLLLWQVSGVASAQPCDPPEVINIEVGPYGFEYDNKSTDPVPFFQRNCPFEVRTVWTNTVPGQSITLSDFRAVTTNTAPGLAHRWDQIETRTLQQGGVNVPGGEATLTEGSPSGTFTLHDSGNPGGPQRLVLFKVTLVTANYTTVTFDPPWSEKRP